MLWVANSQSARECTCLDTVSYHARYYLIFLALCGYASMDWEWLIATHKLGLEPFLPILGYQPVLPPLVETAVNLGYEKTDAQMTLQWGVSRVLLHLGTPDLTAIRATHLAEFEQRQWLALANDLMLLPFSARVSTAGLRLS